MSRRKTMQKTTLMAEAPMRNLIPTLAVPMIIATLIDKIYNLADTYFVSTLGTNATAAVGINGSLQEAIMLFGPLIGVGACSYIARLLGEKKGEQADQVLSTAFFTGVGAGVILMIAGLIFLEPFVRLMGATEDCIAYSMDYARYVLIAAPFSIGVYILSSCLRSEGNSTLVMVGNGIGSVLNCILDPIFIFQLGLGVAGASIATTLSKILSFCILIWPYVRGKTAVRISIFRFRYMLTAMREVLSIGSASFLRMLLTVCAGVLMNWVAGGISTAALAAISVANRVMNFPFSIILGFGQGFQPAIGFNWGAKRYDRVKEGMRFAYAVSAIGVLAMAAVLAVFAVPVIRLFNSAADAQVLQIGVMCIRFQCATMVFHSFGSTVNMFYSAIGRAVPSLLISTARQGYCLIPMLLILPRFWGVYGVASCQAISDLLSALIVIPLGIRSLRIVNEMLRRGEQISSAPEIQN